MARIRTVKPEFFESVSLAQVSRDARLTFIGLFTLADDYGRMRYLPKKITGALYPLDPDVDDADVHDWVCELERVGCVRRYSVDGYEYLELPGWAEHQRIDRPSSSRVPEPIESGSSEARECLASVSRVSRDSLDAGRRKKEEGSRKKEVGSRDSAQCDSDGLDDDEGDGPASDDAANLKAKPKPKRKTRFPDDFVFEERMRQWAPAIRAVQLGADLEQEFEVFRDWHVAHGSLMLDWGAAFRTWLGKYQPRGGRGRPMAPTRLDELRAIWEADEAARGVVDTIGFEVPRMGELDESKLG